VIETVCERYRLRDGRLVNPGAANGLEQVDARLKIDVGSGRSRAKQRQED
jgi:hypothetical protein